MLSRKVLFQREIIDHVLAWFLEEGFEVMLEERLLMDICEHLDAWPDPVPYTLHEGNIYYPVWIGPKRKNICVFSVTRPTLI